MRGHDCETNTFYLRGVRLGEVLLNSRGVGEAQFVKDRSIVGHVEGDGCTRSNDERAGDDPQVVKGDVHNSIRSKVDAVGRRKHCRVFSLKGERAPREHEGEARANGGDNPNRGTSCRGS